MKLFKIFAAVLVALLALTACADDDSTATNGDAELEILVDDLQEAANELENEVANSDVADDLSAAWDDVEAGIDDLVASAATGADDLEDDFTEVVDKFETELDGLGDEASDELAAAWAKFRTAYENVLDELDIG